MALVVRLLTALHLHISSRIDVFMEEIIINVILGTAGTDLTVHFTPINVLKEVNGTVELAKVADNVELDTILVNQITVCHSLNNVLLLPYLMVLDVEHREVGVQKVHSSKALTVCLFNLVKMVLFGIQFISDVYAHLEQLTMVIDVSNVQMIKYIIQELDVLVQKVPLIQEQLANQLTQINVA